MMSFRRVGSEITFDKGARLVLATAGVLQGIFDKPGIVHEFCNRQAVVILRNDGFNQCASFCQRYVNNLNAGVLWADEGWKNAGHYFDAESNSGLWRFPNAVDEFRGYFGQALHLLRRGNHAGAMFFLGAAGHLVQDLCVPHHARGKLLAGHKQYEGWAETNHLKYAVASGGLYQEGQAAQIILRQNALIASDYLGLVETDAGELSYHKATQLLLPLAQRTTAGLFKQFFGVVEKGFKAA